MKSNSYISFMLQCEQPGFELPNMNWGVEKFLHVRMSRPEFFSRKID